MVKNEVLAGENNNDENGDGLDDDIESNLLAKVSYGVPYTIYVRVTNATGSPVRLRGWIDFNNNGLFEPEEYASVIVPAILGPIPPALTWSCAQTKFAPSPSSPIKKLYMRLRISENNNNDAGNANNISNDRRAIGDGDNNNNYTLPYIGEVEDYQLDVRQMEPIGCTNVTYQSDSNLFYSYIYTGQVKTVSYYCANINALGHNTLDNYIWGFDRNSKRLIKIGSGFSIEYFNIPNTPVNADYYIGDIDNEGYYYASEGSSDRYHTIDLNPNRSTYLKYVNPLVRDALGNYVLKTPNAASGYATRFKNTVGSNINIQQLADWAISPVDGFAYSLYGGEGPNSNQYYSIYKINFQTAEVTRIPGTINGDNIQFKNQSFGSVYFDSTNTFVVLGNKNGVFYKIDMVNNIATRSSTAAGFGTDWNDGASCKNANILPVTWVNFTAENINNEVSLEWKTASELNNLGYEIQHSIDGKTWENISFVNSKNSSGNSNIPLNYQFTHTQPSLGNNYYRLKQIDFDGKFEYSKIVAANISSTEAISIYPNPAKDILQIKGLTTENTVTITNNIGSVVKTFTNVKNSLLIKDLPKGIYSISIYSQQNEIIKTLQLVIM